MMTDPIADMLTRIRNAQAVGKADVTVPFSRVKFEIAKLLVHEKYTESVEKTDDTFPQLRIVLKYDDQRQPAIRTIERVSTPGRRVYVKKGELPTVLSNLGVAIISTSQGLMTNKEAKRKQIGGELLCRVW